MDNNFEEEGELENLLEGVSKNPDDKYGYVIEYFKHAGADEFDKIHMKLITEGKNSIGQVIHKSSAVNKLKNEKLKNVPADFYENLEDLIENPSAKGRKKMIEILEKYEDFKRRYDRESMFIKILYRLIPDSFKRAKQIGGSSVVKTSEGHKFSINSTRKNWTANKKYKKWVTKLTRKQRPNKKSEDLCVGSNSICKGDLGIPRKYMPQFDSPAEIQRFTRFVKRVYKIKSFKKTRKARQLKPSQGEINKKRIEGLIEDGVLEKVNVPLVVSGDNYVVDGHHRWAAYRLEKPGASLPVMVIDAPIKDVLGIAVAWGAKHQEF